MLVNLGIGLLNIFTKILTDGSLQIQLVLHSFFVEGIFQVCRPDLEKVAPLGQTETLLLRRQDARPLRKLRKTPA